MSNITNCVKKLVFSPIIKSNKQNPVGTKISKVNTPRIKTKPIFPLCGNDSPLNIAKTQIYLNKKRINATTPMAVITPTTGSDISRKFKKHPINPK